MHNVSWPNVVCNRTQINKQAIMEQKHPLPPFTAEMAKQKVKMAEDAWNSKDPEKISKAYTLIVNGEIAMNSSMAVKK